MMEFYVSGQSLKLFTPVLAADSLNYMTAKVNFADEDWEGYSKWLHFRQGEGLGATVYDMQLDADNEISAQQKLNLTVGQWEVYLTGTKEESRLTTVPLILTVQESGLIDAPLHELPLSVAEQVDYNASLALKFAQEVKAAAEAGEFDGTSLSPLGHFSTEEELCALISEPSPGDVYSVGLEMPYDIYSWDKINLVWRNQGKLQGPAGEPGKDGTVFVPSVDASGNISWLNDGGLENPVTRNIMGPKGEKGDKGEAGPGAYEKAVEAGYTGTRETFYSALTYMPYHNKRHLPEGSDPITVQTDNYADGSITSAKVMDKYRTQYFPLELMAENWQGENAPYSQTVAVEGVLESDRPKLYFIAPEDFEQLEEQQEAFSLIYSIESGEGTLSVYAKELPSLTFSAMAEVTRI